MILRVRPHILSQPFESFLQSEYAHVITTQIKEWGINSTPETFLCHSQSSPLSPGNYSDACTLNSFCLFGTDGYDLVSHLVGLYFSELP